MKRFLTILFILFFFAGYSQKPAISTLKQTSQTIDYILGGGGYLTWANTGTLTLSAENSYSGVTQIENGKIIVKASSGKYGCGNPSGVGNIEAVSNYTVINNTWRTDNFYVFRQYFTISAAIYPNGVTLTELGIS